MATTSKYGVVSFENAKELQKAGFNFETAFYYDSEGRPLQKDSEGDLFYSRTGRFGLIGDTYTPAPNFQELLNALPKHIQVNGREAGLYFRMDYDRQVVGYENTHYHIFALDGLAEAAAELLLLLNTHGLLKK